MSEESNSNSMGDMSKNIEMIQNFSKLMGGGDGNVESSFNPADIMKAVQMAQMLSTFMGNKNNNNQTQEDTAIEASSDTYDVFSPSKEVKILNAAMPFMDRGIQKKVFLLTKFLEMKKINSSDTLSIQSERDEGHGQINRQDAMINAIKPHLSLKEQNDIDMCMKILQIKNMMKNSSL